MWIGKCSQDWDKKSVSDITGEDQINNWDKKSVTYTTGEDQIGEREGIKSL